MTADIAILQIGDCDDCPFFRTRAWKSLCSLDKEQRDLPDQPNPPDFCPLRTRAVLVQLRLR